MPFNMGSGARVGLGNESVWGTPVADSVLVNFLSESLSAMIEKKEEESLIASKAVTAFDLTGIRVSGDLSAILKPEHAGLLLKWAMGGTDVVVQNQGGVTGQHQHTIPLAAASGALPSKTVIVDRKQAIKRYSGCKVASLKLSAKAGDYVRWTVSLKGKDESAGTIATSANPSKKAYKFIGATLIVGGTAYEITGVDLTIDNGLDDGVRTNTSGLYASEPVHSKRKISLSIEKPYDANDETLRSANVLAEAVVASVVLHLESPEIIAASSKYRMDLTLNNVAILDQKTNVAGPGILTSTITAEATAVGATEPLVAVVYDNVNTAYT